MALSLLERTRETRHRRKIKVSSQKEKDFQYLRDMKATNSIYRELFCKIE